jgi:PmbA protein
MDASETTAEKQDHEALNQAAGCLRRALGASRQGSDSARFELYLERRSRLKVDARNQKIDTFSRSEDFGLSIRVLKHQKMGFSFSTSLAPEAIEKAARTACEMAEHMPQDSFQDLPSFHLDRFSSPTALRIHDPDGPNRSTETKIAMALELEELCRQADPRIRAVRSALISETLLSQKLMDHEGRVLETHSTTYAASLSCKAEQSGDNRMGGEALYTPFLSELSLKPVAQNAAQNATELLGASLPPTLTCPAVLRSDVMAELLGFLSASFSAEQVDKGRSMLSLNQLGKKLLSPCITLLDDGLLSGGVGSSPFDGEGTPSGTTTLVNRGYLEQLLCDRYHSKKLALTATGNAGRGIKSPPSISTSNLYLKPGDQTPLELIHGIQKGVMITDLMGVHTANSVTGDFSLGASGFLIENGQISRPISGFAVAGNILDVFQSVQALANDLKFYGTTGSPSALIPRLSVGGSSS